MSGTLYHKERGGFSEFKEGLCIRCSLRKGRGASLVTMLYTVIPVVWGLGCLMLQHSTSRASINRFRLSRFCLVVYHGSQLNWVSKEETIHSNVLLPANVISLYWNAIFNSGLAILAERSFNVKLDHRYSQTVKFYTLKPIWHTIVKKWYDTSLANCIIEIKSTNRIGMEGCISGVDSTV